MPETSFSVRSSSVPVLVGAEGIDYELLDGALHMHPVMVTILEPSPWLLWVRRELNLPELFEYRHKFTGNFILAGWMASGRFAKEIWNYDHRRPWWPGGDERPTTKLSFLSRLKRDSKERSEERITMMRESMSRERLQVQEDLAEKVENSKFLRRRGLATAATQVLEGRTPWAGRNAGGEVLERIKDDLKVRPMVVDMHNKLRGG